MATTKTTTKRTSKASKSRKAPKPRKASKASKAPKAPKAPKSRSRPPTAKQLERKRIAMLRKDRVLTRRTIREGERQVRQTFQSGNRTCSSRRREALGGVQREYSACRKGVEARAIRLMMPMAEEEAQLRRLDAQIPPPVRDPRARQHQEQWEQRLGQEKTNLLARHPELARYADEAFAHIAKAQGKAARALRKQTDQLIQGRPAQSIAEYFEHYAGEHAADIAAQDAAAISRDTRAMIAQHERELARGASARPSTINLILGPASGAPTSLRFRPESGPSSAIEPSRYEPGAMEFPPRSGSVVESILGGPASRAPLTMVSPSSHPQLLLKFGSPRSSRGAPTSRGSLPRKGRKGPMSARSKAQFKARMAAGRAKAKAK